ncbi:uncharacterized protein EV422DRAFT_507953 [Fimicolochytrium jonesii]|uniref:uncharacterized protein n=1 Tax=Fimicolochytrium jonesii TaxID=1396493 RepID=UPI0022FDDEED|nr:uncharacterized protein EV422DRAFT_507953 [Fimicolochytrium jonesii]KAI8818794.1 hypothetical protein EV422DRAFT_507953 [Fimicolochytrium jonesii]
MQNMQGVEVEMVARRPGGSAPDSGSHCDVVRYFAYRFVHGAENGRDKSPPLHTRSVTDGIPYRLAAADPLGSVVSRTVDGGPPMCTQIRLSINADGHAKERALWMDEADKRRIQHQSNVVGRAREIKPKMLAHLWAEGHAKRMDMDITSDDGDEVVILSDNGDDERETEAKVSNPEHEVIAAAHALQTDKTLPASAFTWQHTLPAGKTLSSRRDSGWTEGGSCEDAMQDMEDVQFIMPQTSQPSPDSIILLKTPIKATAEHGWATASREPDGMSTARLTSKNTELSKSPDTSKPKTADLSYKAKKLSKQQPVEPIWILSDDEETASRKEVKKTAKPSGCHFLVKRKSKVVKRKVALSSSWRHQCFELGTPMPRTGHNSSAMGIKQEKKIVCYADGGYINMTWPVPGFERTLMHIAYIGVYFPKEQRSNVSQLVKATSSFEAELSAAIIALQKIGSGVDVEIRTDCQDVITEMKTFQRSSKCCKILELPIAEREMAVWRGFGRDARSELFKAIVTREGLTKIVWVKAHAGLSGNEEADMLATVARTTLVRYLVEDPHRRWIAGEFRGGNGKSHRYYLYECWTCESWVWETEMYDFNVRGAFLHRNEIDSSSLLLSALSLDSNNNGPLCTIWGGDDAEEVAYNCPSGYLFRGILGDFFALFVNMRKKDAEEENAVHLASVSALFEVESC